MATNKPNDAGVVVVLFLMVAAIAYAVFTCVAHYAQVTARFNETKDRRVLRLISGFANVGNGLIHAILVCYMKANEDNNSAYWVTERELGGVEGPAGLMMINTTVGLLALLYGDKFRKLSCGWNAFVAVVGTAVPVVWHRFLAEGLTTWPHVPIFIWFFIFIMELTAFTTSVTWCALPWPVDKAK